MTSLETYLCIHHQPDTFDPSKIQLIIQNKRLTYLEYCFDGVNDITYLCQILQNCPITELLLSSVGSIEIDTAHLVQTIRQSSVKILAVNDFHLETGCTIDLICNLFNSNYKLRSLYFSLSISCSNMSQFKKEIMRSSIREMDINLIYDDLNGYTSLQTCLTNLLEFPIRELTIHNDLWLNSSILSALMQTLTNNVTLRWLHIGPEHEAPPFGNTNELRDHDCKRFDQIIRRNRDGWSPNSHFEFPTDFQHLIEIIFCYLHVEFPNELSFLILNLI